MMTALTSLESPLREILDRLCRIESSLASLRAERAVKEWYTTAEVAAILGRSDYTVREWCRAGRVQAIKKKQPRGAHAEWLIPHEELERIRNG